MEAANIPVSSRPQSGTWKAVSQGSAGMLLSCGNGPFSPSVVTQDNEFHNICHLLALFGVTDFLLIHGLPIHVSLRSWNEADGSHGLSGAAVGRSGLAHPARHLLRPQTQTGQTPCLSPLHSARLKSMTVSLIIPSETFERCLITENLLECRL